MKNSLSGTGLLNIQSAIDAANNALSNFITNLKFSKFKAADVSTSNNCETSPTCNVSSKTMQTVYDSQSTPAAIAFAAGDYLKLVDNSAASTANPYKLSQYDSTDAVQANPVTGKITNINYDYALFEGSNGKKTLLALQSTINDNNSLSFSGKNNPSTKDTNSYSKAGSLEPLPFIITTLYDLKFGYGQVKINSGSAYTNSKCMRYSRNKWMSNRSHGSKYSLC